MSDHSEFPAVNLAENASAPVVKIIGVGSAGVAMLGALDRAEFATAQFVAVNTDTGALAASTATVKIYLENKLMRGLGSAGDPDLGRAMAEEQFSLLKSACEGAGVVFILAGLGGGAGSGICPVLAKAAREAGALVLAFVTLPFDMEGKRVGQARESLELLKSTADGVICLPSQRVMKLVDQSIEAIEIFQVVDKFLIEGVRGVWHLLTRPGLIQIHFGDLCGLLRDRHAENAFAFVEASGPGRAREVVENILSHPMLDEGRVLSESNAVLVSLTAGRDLSMAEINRVIDQVKRHCVNAQLIMGAAVDAVMKDKLCVTIIAAKQGAAPAGGKLQAETRASGGATSAPGVLMSRPARGRKGGARAVQTQLPLTIVSKGRFDKSEPTKYNGEDLDVPTFIRRGVSLN